MGNRVKNIFSHCLLYGLFSSHLYGLNTFLPVKDLQQCSILKTLLRFRSKKFPKKSFLCMYVLSCVCVCVQCICMLHVCALRHTPMNMHPPTYDPALWRAEVNVGFLLVLLSVLYFETAGAVTFPPFETSPLNYVTKSFYSCMWRKRLKNINAQI